MSTRRQALTRLAGAIAVAAIVAYAAATTVHAQEATSTRQPAPGYIEFDQTDAARPTVEVDVTRDMIGDLFGIGDAALAGVAEALAESPQAESSQAIRMAAERAAALRELVEVAQEVVDGIRVRIYDHGQDESGEPEKLLAHFNRQLDAGGWDNVVRINEGRKGVRVAVARSEGTIKGLFVSIFEGNELVFVNVSCDVSPENMKKLAAAATNSGLKAGLGEQLEKAMKHAH